MGSVSVGIVGSGFAAGLHVDALKRVYGVDVKIQAVASRSRPSADAFARRHGIPNSYATPEELLADPSIDVVSICTPNAMHGSLVIEAAQAGKHVICEKPLTGSFGPTKDQGLMRAIREREEAQASLAAIKDALQRAGTQFLYAENWIYAPATTKTKALMRTSGGSVVDIRAEQSHSGSHAPATRRRETAGGGALLTLGAHPIATALHLKAFEGELLCGKPIRVKSVTAETAALYASAAVRRSGSRNWLVNDWKDVETWANLVMNFDDGTKAVVNASFAMLGGIKNTFEVYTTNAVFHNNMTPNSSLQVYTPDHAAFGDEALHEKLESRTGWISASPDEGWAKGYPQEMQDFVECVAEGRQPVAGLELAGDVVQVIYAAYESAEVAQRVKL
ncbi:Gfo/Idh/MocA family protein [Pseudarthrobacter sulfonivorans]|uniref:Gfo/Idh/MocA family protein n=1 Tax=Pseudarthrobacter sulfonivorans TaxID=121292 RepID=UPI002107DD78|nr:Gfo/Idh/MocA family oxidoreductase [Pseudarthrobacter sulfonivorans]